jgi:hypothetical protein
MIYSNGDKYEGEWLKDETKWKGIFTYVNEIRVFENIV